MPVLSVAASAVNVIPSISGEDSHVERTLYNGVMTGADLGQTTYPTTLLGYDKAGKIYMLTMDGRGYGGAGGAYDKLYDYNKDGKLNNKDVVALFRSIH